MFMDITSLQNALGTNVTNSVNTSIQDELGKLIAWTVIPSIILTIVIIVLYVLHSLRRRKIENAILEIRDSLRDIKLTQVAPAEPWPTPEATPSPATPPQVPPADRESSQDENNLASS